MGFKAHRFVCKLLGKQGLTWSGKIALTIDPDILTEMAADVREKIFVVCGTNGKTTINNLLCSTLEGQGKKVICNHSGSNMLNGAIAAFVLSAKWNGKSMPTMPVSKWTKPPHCAFSRISNRIT